MGNLAIIRNNESPATAASLAVGSVDEFELRLFSGKRPYEHMDGRAAVDNWRRDMIALAGEPEARHLRLSERYRSVKDIEPTCAGPISNELSDNLRPVGAKIAPHLSGEQATAWRKAIVMALSDLPPDVALLAVRKTMHTPMQFLSEVETKVRENAAKPMQKLRNAASAYGKLMGRDLPHISGEIGTEVPL
jgi:hypothetical protein